MNSIAITAAALLMLQSTAAPKPAAQKPAGKPAAAAAKRAANDELYITDAQLTHLGDRYLVLPDGHRKYMSVFVGTYPVPTDYSHTDIEDLVSFDRHTLQETLENHKDQFSLTFLAIWQQYQQDILPL